MCDKHVIIVGAGVAGLSAARHLLAAGLAPEHLIVLEASGRYGGRVHTLTHSTPTGGTDILELGATWLHGSIGNPLYDFAAAAGLLRGAQGTNEFNGVPRPDDCPDAHGPVAAGFKDFWSDQDDERPPCYVRPGGVVVRSRHITSAMRAARALLRDAHRLRGDAEAAALRTSVRDYLVQHWAEATADAAAGVAGGPALFSALLEMRHQGECSYTGSASLAEVALAWYGQYAELDGVNTPPPRGFMSIVDALAQPVLAAGVLTLDHPVERVAMVSRGRGASGSAYAVHCADGSMFIAPVVICTVSVGVLQHWTAEASVPRAPVFDPPLPAWKAAAIARLRLGRVEKVHLQYNAFWWRGVGATAEGGTQDADAADQLRKPAGGFVFLWDAHLVNPAAAGTPSPAREVAAPEAPFPGYQPWMAKVFGAYEDREPVDLAAPRLTFWFLGDAAAATDPGPGAGPLTRVGGGPAPESGAGSRGELPDGMTDDHLGDALTMLLEYFLLKAASAPADSGERCDPAVCAGVVSLAPPRPQRVIRSRWGSNPLFRGSYSFIPLGASPADIEALAAPVLAVSSIAAKEACAATDTAGSAASAVAPPLAPPARSHDDGASPLPALLFAGEGTHATFYSTTHGAFESGAREGARAMHLLAGR
jgi:spermine oxidase